MTIIILNNLNFLRKLFFNKHATIVENPGSTSYTCPFSGVSHAYLDSDWCISGERYRHVPNIKLYCISEIQLIANNTKII